MGREASLNGGSKPRIWYWAINRSSPLSDLIRSVAEATRLFSDHGCRLVSRPREPTAPSAGVFAAAVLREAARRCRVSVRKDGSVEVAITILGPNGHTRD